jgi:hypothetical protein
VTKLPCRITLACGHDIATRERPWRGNCHYACRQNTGCGYRIPWISYQFVGDDFVGRNPELDPPPDRP